MRIVLLEPEIPPNTGSVARLAAATQTPLDLIGPLGFSLEDRYLKRAGLDYWPWVDLTVYESWPQYLASRHTGRLLGLSARATRPYTQARFLDDDRLLFGKETSGLGPDVIAMLGADVFTIPMTSPNVRSLNLANAVSIVVYEARRQIGLL
ncbi:MAG TPA: tRNA (cytidine(34)-2'-O)-methyltransferase [Candidatus Binatia bacterium]|nr:tRNA (cytidine(34)-2'-O)-methyltransferase [Candidatus Binatia bacterium]